MLNIILVQIKNKINSLLTHKKILLKMKSVYIIIYTYNFKNKIKVQILYEN